MRAVVVQVAGFLWLAGVSIVAGLLLMGLDRILVARMQGRIGPRLMQPFWDIWKLLKKQEMMPEGAVGWLFCAAPVVALAGALSVLFYVPLFGGGVGDLYAGGGDALLVLYLLLIPGLAMVLGGFASASPYAAIGAQREMVTMLSYELPLATVVLSFAWRYSLAGMEAPLSLGAMAGASIWGISGPLGIIGALLLFVVMLVVTPGELGRIPFDSPEAETELAGGILVEYAGRSLALFQLALAVKTVAMCGILVALFLPWNFGLPAWLAWGVKSGVLLFAAVSLPRAAMARLRISQVAGFYWKWLGAMAFLGLLCLALDARLHGGLAA